jgi:hypothetical protein
MDSKEFLVEHKAICEKMHETTQKKNSDYCGTSGDPFKNFKLVSELGITDAETAIAVRMSDKMARIASFLQKGSLLVADETVEDTCIDLANYAIILALWFKEKNRKVKYSSGSANSGSTVYSSNTKGT